jgi:hypothetical protein
MRALLLEARQRRCLSRVAPRPRAAPALPRRSVCHYQRAGGASAPRGPAVGLLCARCTRRLAATAAYAASRAADARASRVARRLAEADALLLIHGRNELEEKSKPKWKLLAEQARAAAASHSASGRTSARWRCAALCKRKISPPCGVRRGKAALSPCPASAPQPHPALCPARVSAARRSLRRDPRGCRCHDTVCGVRRGGLPPRPSLRSPALPDAL